MATASLAASRSAHADAGARREAWRRRAPLLPALIFLIALTQLPFLGTLIVSTFEWNALFPTERRFVGLDNFAEVFGNEALRSSVFFTVRLTLTVVLVSLVLGLVLALLLNEKFIGRSVVRTLLIAPFLIVPVAAALLWKHLLLNPGYGLINGTIAAMWRVFGDSTPPQPSWITDYPAATVQAALIWQWTPFMMLILLAGLQSRPGDVMEAARVDGAGWWQTFRYMTLPHLRRYIELGVLLGSIYIIQNFDAVFTMTSGAFDTANLPYTVYRTFFQAQDYGLASAMGVVVVAFTIPIATLFLRTTTSLLQEEGAR